MTCKIRVTGIVESLGVIGLPGQVIFESNTIKNLLCVFSSYKVAPNVVSELLLQKYLDVTKHLENAFSSIFISLLSFTLSKCHYRSLSHGLQTFSSEGHISYHTTVRDPDILRNVIVSAYITFY